MKTKGVFARFGIPKQVRWTSENAVHFFTGLNCVTARHLIKVKHSRHPILVNECENFKVFPSPVQQMLRQVMFV